MTSGAVLLNTVARQSRISDVDIVRLRDCLTHEGPICEQQARVLLQIELSNATRHISWKAYFLDAMLEFAIHTAEPHGYLTADNTDWLLRHAAPEGRILSPLLFEMLTTLLCAARWAPQRLVSALLDEVYCAVASGDGPLRPGLDVPAGVITGRDVEVVRRILYASGAGDLRAINRAEAAGLLAIDAACARAPLLPAWADLFCKALYDAALAASACTGPAREVFLAPQAGLSVASLIEAIHVTGQRYRSQSAEDLAITALERQRYEIVTGDTVEPCTAGWFCTAFNADRPGTAAFALLFEALIRQRINLHADLQSLLAIRTNVRAA